MYDNTEHTARAQCYLHSSSPSIILDWNRAYSDDMDTKVIITALLGYKSDDVPKISIESVYMGYRQHLKKGHIVIFDNKLMLCKPINMESKYIGFMISP